MTVLSKNGEIVKCQCSCGREFEVVVPADFPPASQEFMLRGAEHATCEECGKERELKEREESKQADLEYKRKKLMAVCEIPVGYRVESPPIRTIAEWVWRHRAQSILLSGTTGTGKSTSACFVGLKLIGECRKVKYTTLRQLLAEWKEVKTSDKRWAVDKFLGAISALDVLIIDEVIAKSVVSPSGQELLFELVDGVYSKQRKTRIWLLGNFYSGSLAEMFVDPEPLLRRIKYSFACGVAGDDGKVSEVW